MVSWSLVWIALPNLATAAALGTAIGAERQWRHRTAGLKTNALVAVGAASFVITASAFGAADSQARIAAQIVSGIGFLGAGVILREGVNIRGLNTAATLWCSAAAGTLAGSGELVLAWLTAAAVLGINLGLQPLVNLVNRMPAYAFRAESIYAVSVHCHPGAEAEIRAALTAFHGQNGIRAAGLTSTRMPHGTELQLRLYMPIRDDAAVDRLLQPIAALPDVTSTRWAIEATIE
ncbi:MAG TPA: MgtC/SapB family protein [Stellaceae bacterium]|nr:MgtC/SapB family protein [Stellaceae bacterium]